MKQVALTAGAFAAADQTVKLLINRFFRDESLCIIPGLLSFKPVHNTAMSWFGSLGFAPFADRFFAVGFNILVFLAAGIFFKYIYINKKINGKLSAAIFTLLFAGVVSSTLDRIFWGGSLDYLRLEGFFTFDLKDCYISAFVVLAVYSSIKYKKKWEAFYAHLPNRKGQRQPPDGN